MAYTKVISSGETLIVPDSAVSITVANNPSGIATSGVLALVGEADEGPSWDQESTKLSDNSFGPTDINRVVAKYGSGRLVDAFRGAASPSGTPRIQGSPNRFIIVKTNQSSKAARTTEDSHGTFTAKRGGEPGNLIKELRSTGQAEVAPSTSSLSYVPSASAASMAVRVNGGAKQTLSISANTSPAALAASIVGLSGLNAVGGVDRGVVDATLVSSGATLAVSNVSGQNVRIQLSAGDLWAAAPAVGDTARIPSGSAIEGAGSANVGWYLVTGVSNTNAAAYIDAKKITSGAPVAVSAADIAATSDLTDYSSMSINNMSGTNRNILTGLVGQNVTITAASSNLTATLAAGQVWASTPRVGDIVYIPSGSAFQGAGNANVGWHQVTAVSNTTSSAFITAARLSNGSPVAVATTAIVAVSDIQCNDKQIKGVGKSMEIWDNAGAVNINTIMKQLGVDSAASWIGSLLSSSAELKKTISLVRSSTNTQETFTVGGNVAMTMGYAGTTASATIAPVSGVLRLQTSVVGGSGSNLNIDLSKVPTLNDLVSMINSNTGYTAAVGSALDGQRNPSVLDEMTLNICSDLGSNPGRIKRDLFDLIENNGGLNGSQLISYTAIATAGLPEDSVSGYSFLSGGAKGGSSGLQMTQAIDALQAVRCNFVVPLVSQDASDDILEGETESSSTYTVDSVNAAVKSHCLAMSTAKIKRHRVAVVSKRSSFTDAKLSAQTMANYRIAHVFQDIIDLDSSGELKQFQPWMGSAKAAGLQAAGSYKSITAKLVNISGALQDAGDFDDENVTQLEDAILAGLIPIQRQESGGFAFTTDQTTYGIDNNVIYNSLQAVYVADLMALSLAESLKRAFVGESVADVTTGAVISFIKSKMFEFLQLKFTVATAAAPGGWKSIDVNIDGSVMEVNCSVVEATAIKFIPINLTIEGIKSSAAA